MPGKIPKSLSGAWQFNYMLQEATLESGQSNLHSTIFLSLHEDGTYQLHYVARWGFPSFTAPGPIPTPVSGGGLDGRNVTEEGKFSLSGEVLLLEPTGIVFSEVDNNAVVNQQTIRNETHTLIVRVNKAKLTLAGRCASYQVDPVCAKTPIVWFTMNVQVGTRWLGREPR